MSDSTLVFAETVAPEDSERLAPVWERRQRSGPLLDRARAWYGGLSRRGQMITEVLFASGLPLVVGYLTYLVLAFVAPSVLGVVFWVILASLLATSLLIAVECARATRFPEPPVRHVVADEDLPRLATIIAAYLPNEAETIVESVRAHLALDYPADRTLVVCAYNTPTPLLVEEELAALALADSRFLPLKVNGSTSKASNVSAALRHLEGFVDVVGIFDADHHPDPSAPRRVARWLGDAAGDKRYDVVQGQCLVRNVNESRVTQVVAAEFGTLYAVSHPGRTVFNDFGIFGGSNGWWRAETLCRHGLDEDMLTEDIDVTARALTQGARLATDPRIVSSELAPATVSALWRQRMRWSQGWWQVSLRHFGPLVRSQALTGTQRRGVGLLFGWRVIHPWIATQMVPLMLAGLTAPGHKPVKWTLLAFMLTTLFVNGIPLLQGLVANRLAPPSLRDRGWMYLRFALISTLLYSEFKAVITRAAVLRQLLGVSSWDVTARRTTIPAQRSA